MPKIEATHPHVNCGTGTCRWAPPYQVTGPSPGPERRRANHGSAAAVLAAGDWDGGRMAAPHYVIRGGLEGRERLRVLARVMWPATRAVLEPLVARDARCLDVGCGEAT